MKYIALGVVTKPFGVRGDVRVKPYNLDTTWFEGAEGVWLNRANQPEPEYFRVVNSRRHKDVFVLSLEGVRDRDGAEALRGREAVAPEDQLEPLDDGEFFWYQLVGLEVETEGGEKLGRVARMEETSAKRGGADLFVIESESGEIMLPATEQAIKTIDLESKKITVGKIPGLTAERNGDK